jgi:mRNA interferase YafQ
MRRITQWKQFRQDYLRQERRGKKMYKLEAIISFLAEHDFVDSRHRPHKLTGEWKNFWECHIEYDWLLIYYATEHEVLLVRTGTHSDLFD